MNIEVGGRYRSREGSEVLVVHCMNKAVHDSRYICVHTVTRINTDGPVDLVYLHAEDGTNVYDEGLDLVEVITRPA